MKFLLQLDNQSKSLDTGARTSELSTKRSAVSKLLKDFEKLQQSIASLKQESQFIKVSLTDVDANTTKSNEYGELSAAGNSQARVQKLVALDAVDVDMVIIEERERDIKQINKDITIVHEMFK